MVYTFDVDATTLLADHTTRFIRLGVPAGDVDRARSVITNMWRNEPGGWVYEWSKLAGEHARRDAHHQASLVYGCAKYPGLVDPGRVWAYARQLQEYQAATPTFDVWFERRALLLSYRGRTVELPVHLYCRKPQPVDASDMPVVLIGGGLDTWKVELHPWCVALARSSTTVLAFDLPGTGENLVDLDPSADEIIMGLIAAARGLGNGQVAYVGMSFGGNFTAMAGLRSLVDAAAVLGSPIRYSFTPDQLRRLPHGMKDIVGNAIGYPRPPPFAQFVADAGRLARGGLLRRRTNSPMLVVHAADDRCVPPSDVLLFEGRPDTEVHLIPTGGHGAVVAMDSVLPMTVDWLVDQLSVARRS